MNCKHYRCVFLDEEHLNVFPFIGLKGFNSCCVVCRDKSFICLIMWSKGLCTNIYNVCWLKTMEGSIFLFCFQAVNIETNANNFYR